MDDVFSEALLRLELVRCDTQRWAVLVLSPVAYAIAIFDYDVVSAHGHNYDC